MIDIGTKYVGYEIGVGIKCVRDMIEDRVDFGFRNLAMIATLMSKIQENNLKILCCWIMKVRLHATNKINMFLVFITR